MGPRMLLLGDSLAYHGPDRDVLLTDARLFPNVAACELGGAVDVVARLGWTTRDAWWALTKDPHVYSVLLPEADVLVLGVGGMDQLPASLPVFLREGIAYLRPGWVRRRVRQGYRRAHPVVVRATRGRARQLPQHVTDHYRTRIVTAVRQVRPQLPVVVLTPSPYDAQQYPSVRHHETAVVATREWSAEHDAVVVELDPIVGPALAAGIGNPDGMHWGWPTHTEVGLALAAAVGKALAG